jgi:hypothetical protein
MNKFSDKSKGVLDTLDKDLQLVLIETLAISVIDFSLIEGYRSPEKQFEYFKIGREFKNGVWKIVDPGLVITTIDGSTVKGKHNYCPSQAVDLCIYIPGRPDLVYDKPHLCYLAGTIISIAEYLYRTNKITKKIIWGGNWNHNGIIIYDHSLQDLPHFQTL